MTTGTSAIISRTEFAKPTARPAARPRPAWAKSDNTQYSTREEIGESEWQRVLGKDGPATFRGITAFIERVRIWQ